MQAGLGLGVPEGQPVSTIPQWHVTISAVARITTVLYSLCLVLCTDQTKEPDEGSDKSMILVNRVCVQAGQAQGVPEGPRASCQRSCGAAEARQTPSRCRA